MGNVEATALTRSSPINADAVIDAYKQYMTYGKKFIFDRSAFALLFDAERVPFTIIDAIFEAADANGNGQLEFAELALTCSLCASNIPLDFKLKMLFDALDAKDSGELSWKELSASLHHLIVHVVQSLRGKEINRGRVSYPNLRCSACKEIPTNVVYQCLECTQGVVMGIPIAVHLCSSCVGSWEGYGPNHELKHTKKHYVEKVKFAPNPHAVTHVGIRCSACGMTPIVGTRTHCCDCQDLVELCHDCSGDNETPLSHQGIHKVIKLEAALSLDEEVSMFLTSLFQGADQNADGKLSLEEFIGWGRNNEQVTSLLGGFDTHHVILCGNWEGCECSVEEATVTV